MGLLFQRIDYVVFVNRLDGVSRITKKIKEYYTIDLNPNNVKIEECFCK